MQNFASLGNGPLWHGRDLGKQCRKYWWTNLLFINNFHPESLMDECIGQSWYLGCDFQFFIMELHFSCCSSESTISSISLRHTLASRNRIGRTSYGDYVSKHLRKVRYGVNKVRTVRRVQCESLVFISMFITQITTWTQVQFLTSESRRYGQVQEQRLRQTSISNLNVFDWYDGWYDFGEIKQKVESPATQ